MCIGISRSAKTFLPWFTLTNFWDHLLTPPCSRSYWCNTTFSRHSPAWTMRSLCDQDGQSDRRGASTTRSSCYHQTEGPSVLHSCLPAALLNSPLAWRTSLECFNMFVFFYFFWMSSCLGGKCLEVFWGSSKEQFQSHFGAYNDAIISSNLKLNDTNLHWNAFDRFYH